MWPKGVESVEDVPSDLAEAVGHANKILDWYENLPPDEMPPSWMWPFNDEITDWFENIKFKKEANRQSDEPITDVARNEDPRLDKLRALKGGI